MASRLIWHGKKVNRTFRQHARQNVLDAAMLVEALVKSSMKKGGTVESGEAVLRAGTRGVMEDSVTGARAGRTGSFTSSPGEVPRVQTGRLKGSITSELHPVLPIARVGTDVPYAPKLEFGTGRIAPRPYMRPALHRAEPAIAALWERPVREGQL